MKSPTFFIFYNSIIPIATLIIGAIVHHWFTKSQESTKLLQTLRLEAYSDFFKGFINFALNDEENEGKMIEDRILIESAHLRMVLYGDEKVIKETAKFWRSFQSEMLIYDKSTKIEDKKKIESQITEKFMPILEAIRQTDFKIKKNAPKNDIKLLLLWGDLLDEGKLPEF